jgi:hypothetical protein
MRKMIETAALGLSLCLAGLGIVTYAHAQDPEEGAVDLNETAKPAPEPRGAPAWESPPSAGGMDSEDARSGAGASEEPRVKEPGPGKLRLFVGPRLGLGGTFHPKGFSPDRIYAAAPTLGAQLGADYVLMKYFALGLETRLSWLEETSSKSQYMVWDLLLKPRVQYKIKPYPIEIYLAVPGGLSMNKPGDQKVVKNDGTATKEKGKIGASLGIFGGASYFFNDDWALNAELGWNWTFLRFDTWVTEVGLPGTPSRRVPSSAKVTVGQLTLLALNVVRTF